MKQEQPKQPKQLKTRKINICLSENEYSILSDIRACHCKSISELMRDAICFYSLYYSNSNDLK